MTVLSRLTKLGMARSDNGAYLAPTVSIPWNHGTKYADITAPLRDESARANDALLQGLVAGPQQTDWQVDVNGYADIIGNLFVAMGLFDTVTAGISTTLSAATTVGATSISTAASIPANTTIKITSTGGGTDYAITGTPSGAGPYTIPITSPATGLVYAHNSSDPVVAQSTHTFTQNRSFTTTWPKYCFTTDDGVDQLGWAGCVASDLVMKVDPKGLVTFSVKYVGQPSSTQATFPYAASTQQPTPAWAWTVSNAGAASTRGISMDITLKRALDVIHSSTGTQAPREVFPGPLEIDGTYKAVFETDGDINLFRQYSQAATVHTLTNPLSLGGAVLAITMSQSGYTTSEVDLTNNYTQLTQALSGINNATDGGVASVTLTNFQVSAY